ncbi:hypothetical protein K1719_034135 [Acacia pycnantha]|nr:hypothetical protein K1719_034135 [Acacia pycnantha]
MSCLQKDEGGFFFVYGCGRTGKTFLWNALTSSLRAKGKIVLTVASSGIAATLLPYGRTAHSRTDRDKLVWFSRWLLDVGDGKIGDSHDGVEEIEIPGDLLISGYQDPIRAIVESTYINLLENLNSNEYFNDRAILAPTIEMTNSINEHMCDMLLGEPYEFLSCDSVCKSSEDSDSFDNLYTIEFLNTISCSGMPPHKLTLKVGAPIMLLRNIDQSFGLCNGTRLRLTHLGKTVIQAITLNGLNPNQKVLIHRMDMNPSESKWPFRMKRRQFPITLSFAMTINKSQGQSLRHIGLYLCKPVFTHDQLYVALSRVKSMDGLNIVVDDNSCGNKNKTRNVVYKEIFKNVN